MYRYIHICIYMPLFASKFFVSSAKKTYLLRLNIYVIFLWCVIACSFVFLLAAVQLTFDTGPLDDCGPSDSAVTSARCDATAVFEFKGQKVVKSWCNKDVLSLLIQVRLRGDFTREREESQ